MFKSILLFAFFNLFHMQSLWLSREGIEKGVENLMYQTSRSTCSCSAEGTEPRDETSINFFSIHIRNYIYKLQIDKLLYNTTMTIPGGAKYHDYPLALRYPSGRKRSEVHSFVQFVTHLSLGFSTRGVPRQKSKYNN